MDGILYVPERLMALDRPYDEFETGDARPEQHLPPGGDVPAVRAGPAEPRTREECYEALRAADGGPGDSGSGAGGQESADSGTDHSGWDAVDAADRPSVAAIGVSPERTTHILDGDGTEGGGGHRHGVGKPGKTEFPASWDDEKIIANILDVVRRPDKSPIHQDWNDTWLCTGTRDNVDVSAVVERSGNILTGWPEEGSPGVVRNPRKGTHDRG
jgi:Bacterial EndoU nuclease